MSERPTSDTKNSIELRPSVQWFAERMELTLRKHDATKGGQRNWRQDTANELLDRVFEEACEVRQCLRDCGDADDVIGECCDVANMALMVADVYAGKVSDE